LIENPEHTEWQPDRSKNPLQEKELIKAINSYIKDRIEELVQNSSDDAIDAVGVGNFIPDVATDTNNTANEEVVSDKVIDIEISKVNKSAKTGKIPGESERNDYEDTNGSMEPGGSDEEWFSDDGKIIDPSNRPAGPASIRENGDDTVPRKLSVGLEKFISICVDKDKGKYVLMIVPDRDADNATIKLFLSAETQKYEAPIVKSMYEGKDIKIERNELKEIIFRGNQPSRISVELDYHDYCSMEVEIYAVEK
jgi:hypothetical protein